MTNRMLFAALATGTLALGGALAAQEVSVTTEGSRIDGSSVIFPNVMMDQDGYAVVHAMEGGAPVAPSSLGHAAVSAGANPEVSVPVEGLAPGDYMVMLHHETNGNASYDFGEGATDVDTPAMNADGAPVTAPFSIGQM